MAKKGGGHHGGAWKVAYADFVTAMMALFMVLWISNQNIEIRKATSKFFQDPYNAFHEKTSGMMNASVAGARNDQDTKVDPTAPANLGYLQAIAKELYRIVNVEEKEDEKTIDIQVTSDGLRINLFNRAKKPIYQKDSAEFTDWGRFVVQTVAWMIDRYSFKVYIDGHTAAGTDEIRRNYGSWELSADRANSARRALVYYAVDGKLIERVTGYGDTDPMPNTTPEAETNERMTISLSAQQATFKKAAAATAAANGGHLPIADNLTTAHHD